MKYIESVKNLRTMIAQQRSPICKCSGVYRWWFKKDAALKLLATFPQLRINKLLHRKIDGEVYLALYYGISINLKQRAKWHICQHHTNSAVKSGYLSTLRHTLSALLGKDLSISEKCVNDFMDHNCYFEWDYSGNPQDEEKKELTQTTYCYPLNIQGNKSVSKSWLNTLIALRKKI